MQKQLMITVDVEAQPMRAEHDPVDCLIWGNFPDGRLGIGEMMDIADRHGMKLTMFLDYCEEHLYGGALLDAGREIHRRGHDLQLHAHLDFLDREFWVGHGIARETNLNKLDDAQANAAFNFLCDRHRHVTGKGPLAFRGGGYRYNGAVLKAMAERGVMLSTSVNVSRNTQPILLPRSKQFLWSSGCFEIPVSCVAGYRNLGYLFDFNFNSGYFTDAEAMTEYLDVFYSEFGEDAVAVLVMHSWSFLKLTDKKYFTETVPVQAEKFDTFLARIAGQVKLVTASELVWLHGCGKLSMDPTLDFTHFRPPTPLPQAESPVTPKSGKPGVPESVRFVPPLPIKEECPICGAEKSRFIAMNGRRCPECGSLERQRCFAIAYDQSIRAEFDLTGKHVLIFSPSVSELSFLKARGIEGKTSVDIRPDSKPDIVADICAMPQIATGSQGCIFASYIMPNVHDMEAALDEIARILAPGGCFFSVEMLRAGLPSSETKDELAITGWYGKENFEKYKVGSFRVLGEDDYLTALSKRFKVTRYAATDPITGQATVVHLCRLPVHSEKQNNMEQNHFESADKAYENYKVDHPDATYAQFSVAMQLASINRGVLHPTLGTKTQKYADFWNAGELDFVRYLNLLNITNNHKIVDYGCGSLRLGAHFIRYLEPGGYFGIDVTTDFIEFGKEVLGEAFLCEKKPKFGAIEEDAIAAATEFNADFVISTACAFQIRPEEKIDFIRNIKRLASKPGCIVCFDTKIGREGLRYKSSAWVWSLDYYRQAMAPLALLANHKISQHHELGEDFEGQILVFGHSQAQPLETPPKEASSTPLTNPASAIDTSFEHLLTEVIHPTTSFSHISARFLPHAPLSSAQRKLVEKDFAEILPPVLSSWKDLANPALAGEASGLSAYPHNSIHFFVSSGILDFLADFNGILANAARVLCPGGYALFRIKSQRLVAGELSPSIAYMIEPGTVGLPTDASLPSMKVGRAWLMTALAAVGLEPQHYEYLNEETGETVVWFVGRKPSQEEANDPFASADGHTVRNEVLCDICKTDLSGLENGQTACPKCRSAPRTRTLLKLSERLFQLFPTGSRPEDRALLAFAMDSVEERALIPKVYGNFKSASLYGAYRQGHEEGVDVRDLSRYGDASFDGVSGILLFDYFEEHEKALAEIARVLKSGGVFFTHIASYRLSADEHAPPTTTSIIKKRPNYFEYVPDNANMPSINVGRSWFLSAMRRVGLEPELIQIVDGPSGERIDWFVGTKPGTRGGKGMTPTEADMAPQPVRFSVPLPVESGYEQVHITISLPPVPNDAKQMGFAEHVMDVKTGEATQTVVMCGTGKISTSEDLGKTWRTIHTKGLEDYRWSNCFTTSTGRHIVQSIGWQGTSDPITDPEKHAALILFDKDWNVVGRSKTRDGYWHGTASIGEAGGTLMFAEYYNNLERYSADFEARRDEILKTLRPNAIWRSRDDGISWEKVLEFSPLEIRHFHTVIPDRFSVGTWWASSGDKKHETRVWRTDDDGDTWIDVTNTEPNISLPSGFMPHRVLCQRYTDAVIDMDAIIWGADDYLDFIGKLGRGLPRGDMDAERSGSRVYVSPKSMPLLPREVGYIGHPVRSLVDVGPGWIVLTEAKQPLVGIKPFVFLLMKGSLLLVKLTELENWSGAGTGFTFSRASKKAHDGCFFTFRRATDVFNGGVRCLKWQVEFE